MKIRKSNNLYTPGGRPVSPIAEEGREDLEVVDIAKMCEDGGNKLVQKLITQLRDLIAQWDWAQARHRHVAKIVLILFSIIIFIFFFTVF